MNILQIVSAKTWGGGEQYVYDVSSALAAQHRIFIAVNAKSSKLIARFTDVATVLPLSFCWALWGINQLPALIRLIKREHLEMVNFHSGRAALLSIFLKIFTGVKVVSFKHNIKRAKRDFYHRWQRSQIDAFICVSNLAYTYQTQGLTEPEKAKFYMVYNGVNPQRLSFKVHTPPIKDQVVLGYAGRLAANKGLGVLLQSLQKLRTSFPQKNFTLLVAGTGSAQELAFWPQEAQRLSLSDKVQFLPNVNDMAAFYAKIDILVAPSLTKESFGLTVCEAMYCGVPTVATTSGAQAEIITHEINGMLSVPGDANHLAENIGRLIAHPPLYQALAQSGHERVLQHFMISHCAQHLAKIFQQLK